MSEFNEIAEKIYKLESTDELRQIWDIVKVRFNELEKRQAMKFRRGENVEWDSHKRPGVVIKGVIVSVNDKTLTVKADDGMQWRVAPSFCRKIEGGK